MAKTTRLVKTFLRLLLPAILLIILAVVGASVWLTYRTAAPPTAKYIMTPGQYGQLSSRGAQVTDETWSNKDGSTSRGWLLRGADNAPAVILFHKYGADRSHVLNLGVKLNESTNFTVLMPDLRAHGDNPSVKNTSFGGCESEDADSCCRISQKSKEREPTQSCRRHRRLRHRTRIACCLEYRRQRTEHKGHRSRFGSTRF